MNGLEESTTPTRSHVRVVIMVGTAYSLLCSGRGRRGLGEVPRCESGGGHGAAHTALSIKNFNLFRNLQSPGP